jgi:hypothetical protein
MNCHDRPVIPDLNQLPFSYEKSVMIADHGLIECPLSLVENGIEIVAFLSRGNEGPRDRYCHLYKRDQIPSKTDFYPADIAGQEHH